MISIVTPSFQQMIWLRLCVASVADQDGVAVEHIVQDGGTGGISVDGLRPCGPNDNYQLRLLVEKDEGMYDAINRGLERATGEVCAYLNCDEQYLPGTLAKVARFFGVHPEIDLLFGDFIVVDDKGEPLSYRRVVPPTANHIRFAHLNTASCAMFFRRRLIERGFLFDPQWKTIGDAAWVKGLLEAGVRMQVLPEPLAVFTFTGKNLGASEVSRAEVARLSAGARFSPVRRTAAVLTHRFHKLVAGAYRAHQVDYAIYTLASPHARERRSAEKLGFGWPASGTKAF